METNILHLCDFQPFLLTIMKGMLPCYMEVLLKMLAKSVDLCNQNKRQQMTSLARKSSKGITFKKLMAS